MLTPGFLGAIAAASQGVAAGGARWWDLSPQAPTWTTQSGYNNVTIRVVMLAGVISGSKLRLRFQASASQSTVVSHVYVQIGSTSGDPYDFASTPVEVMFGGAAGFSLTADQYIDSDDVALPLAISDSLVVSFVVASTNVQRRASNYVPGFRMYYKAGNDATTQNTSGYTEQAWPVDLVRVEAFDSAPTRTPILLLGAMARNDSWSNYNVRQVLPAGFFSTSYSKLRFRLVARGTAYTIDSMYIGLKATSGGAYDFNATPTQVTFGGSGSKSVGTHQVAISDDVSFSCDATTQLVIAMHVATGGTSVPNNGAMASASVYYKTGSDQSSTLTVTGYTGPTTTYGMPIFKIEAW